MTTIIAFDLYGTLLDTSSIAKKLESRYGEKAKGIAGQWRRYQLEYTWRLNSVGVYEPFDVVTKKALSHAVKEVGETVDDTFADELMKEYDSLDTFPDIEPALQKLVVPMTESAKAKPVIFSNGTRSMVEASVAGSDLLSNKTRLFSKKEDSILIDEISTDRRKYKPDPVTYSWLCSSLGIESRGGKENVWLITANPFDVDGAKRYGLKVCWVNRAGGEWIDGIGMSPDYVCKDVGDCICKIAETDNISGMEALIKSFSEA